MEAHQVVITLPIGVAWIGSDIYKYSSNRAGARLAVC